MLFKSSERRFFDNIVKNLMNNGFGISQSIPKREQNKNSSFLPQITYELYVGSNNVGSVSLYNRSPRGVHVRIWDHPEYTKPILRILEKLDRKVSGYDDVAHGNRVFYLTPA